MIKPLISTDNYVIISLLASIGLATQCEERYPEPLASLTIGNNYGSYAMPKGVYPRVKPVSEETKQKISQASKRNHNPKSNLNLTYRFPKGHTPWSKGKKTGRIPWNKGLKTGIQTSGQFKPGQEPWNKGLTTETDERIRKYGEKLKGHAPTFTGWKGKKFSNEHRKNLSEAHKGLPSGNKGKKASLESRKKMSEAHKGHTVTEATRKKLSEAHKKIVHVMTPQCWEAAAKANTGRKLSAERRRKIGEGNKGKIVSEETRRKMSESSKRGMTKERIKKILTRRTPTNLESKFLKIIEEENLPYKYIGDGSFTIGRSNPDFINVNGAKILVEVYADYFKIKKFGDVETWKNGRSKQFKKFGWMTVYFNASEITKEIVLKRLGEAERQWRRKVRI